MNHVFKKTDPLIPIYHKRIWMFGPPGSGKTTISNLLAARYSLPVIHVGEEIRKKYGERTILESSKAMACPEYEDEVKKMVVDFTRNSTHGFIIDSAPRGIQQVKFYLGNTRCIHSGGDLVIYLTCPHQTIFNRIKNRSDESITLAHKVLGEFDSILPNMIMAFRNFGVRMLMINNGVDDAV